MINVSPPPFAPKRAPSHRRAPSSMDPETWTSCPLPLPRGPGSSEGYTYTDVFGVTKTVEDPTFYVMHDDQALLAGLLLRARVKSGMSQSSLRDYLGPVVCYVRAKSKKTGNKLVLSRKESLVPVHRLEKAQGWCHPALVKAVVEFIKAQLPEEESASYLDWFDRWLPVEAIRQLKLSREVYSPENFRAKGKALYEAGQVHRAARKKPDSDSDSVLDSDSEDA